VQDLTGQTLAWNYAATQLYGWSEEEALSLNVHQRIPKMQQKDALSKLKQLSNDDEIEPYRTQRLTKAGLTLDIWMTATALLNESGELFGIATMEQVLKGKNSD
jgi:two-component system CheB/CheR fusion protein